MCVLLLTKDCGATHRWMMAHNYVSGPGAQGTSDQGYPLYYHRHDCCYLPLNQSLCYAAAWALFVCVRSVRFGYFRHCQDFPPPGWRSQSELAFDGQIPTRYLELCYSERRTVQSGLTQHVESVLLSCCQASIRNWLSPVMTEEDSISVSTERIPEHRVPAMGVCSWLEEAAYLHQRKIVRWHN